MKVHSKIFYLFAVLILMLSSCKKEKIENDIPSNELITTTDLSGFGNRPGNPSVTPFELPENIEISNPILAYDSGMYYMYGYGWGGSAYFTMTNNNNFNIDVTLPERLVIIADNDSAQNNLLLYPLKISLLANESRKIRLIMFCTNHDKGTWNANYYEILGLSNNDQVVKLTNSLKNKSESIISDHDIYVQGILWHITDGNGLTQADLDSISSW